MPIAADASSLLAADIYAAAVIFAADITPDTLMPL